MQEVYSEGWNREKFLDEIKSFNSDADTDKIGKAYDLAKKAHIGQKRASGRDYFEHVQEVAYIVATLKLDTSAICASLLHDTLEDTKTKPEDIEAEFGNEVLLLVEGVTKQPSDRIIENKRAENIRKVLLATAKDVRVIVIKLADRLHNMRTLKYLPLQTQKEIAKETLEIYEI